MVVGGGVPVVHQGQVDADRLVTRFKPRPKGIQNRTISWLTHRSAVAHRRLVQRLPPLVPAVLDQRTPLPLPWRTTRPAARHGGLFVGLWPTTLPGRPRHPPPPAAAQPAAKLTLDQVQVDGPDVLQVRLFARCLGRVAPTILHELRPHRRRDRGVVLAGRVPKISSVGGAGRAAGTQARQGGSARPADPLGVSGFLWYQRSPSLSVFRRSSTYRMSGLAPSWRGHARRCRDHARRPDRRAGETAPRRCVTPWS